jgi:hypothetical protein
VGEKKMIKWWSLPGRNSVVRVGEKKMIKWWSLPGTNSVVRVGEKMIALQVKDEEFEGFGYEDGE